MKTLILTTAFYIAMAPVSFALAQTCSKQSPAHTVALLELYTSEGCSSCPPADHTVSGLKQAASSDLVVPLSLHVDYWDYIGWTDRFAKADFSQRQRWLTSLGRNNVVYTPEIFFDGRELRGWQDNLATSIASTNRQPAQASIGISAGNIRGGKLPVEVKTTSDRSGNLFIALYENGLSSDVKSGENSGVVLRHDFVVRDWSGPIALAAGGNAHSNVAEHTLTIPAGANPQQLGVAAFIQSANGQVLQALALPLCKS